MVSSIKILVIGEVAVGKTSITTRYTTGGFKESHLMTIGPNFMLQDYKSKNGNNYRLSIWDTAGQENVRKIVEGYIKMQKVLCSYSQLLIGNRLMHLIIGLIR